MDAPQRQVDPHKEEWGKAVTYIVKHIKNLRKNYGNDYVAFTGDGVIDSGKSDIFLSKRVRSANPGKIIFISKIEKIVLEYPRK